MRSQLLAISVAIQAARRVIPIAETDRETCYFALRIFRDRDGRKKVALQEIRVRKWNQRPVPISHLHPQEPGFCGQSDFLIGKI